MSTHSTTLVQTPNVAKIRERMGQALMAEHPLEFRFTVERFGSMEVAKSRATSLANQFNSIRARARNTLHVTLNRKDLELVGEQIKGMYDDLACTKQPLPNNGGYVVTIGRVVMEDFEVYNGLTGERIVDADPRIQRRDFLGDIFIKKLFNKAVRPPYLTLEQEQELYRLDPEFFINMFEHAGLPIPSWVQALATVQSDNALDFDLVDTPIDDFGA